jgi:hypothetical protein
MDPGPYQLANNHSPGQETPHLLTESEDTLPFIYKTNSMHKLQTHLKVHNYYMFQHVRAILKEFVHQI